MTAETVANRVWARLSRKTTAINANASTLTINVYSKKINAEVQNIKPMDTVTITTTTVVVIMTAATVAPRASQVAKC